MWKNPVFIVVCATFVYITLCITLFITDKYRSVIVL